jgi:hypothetical protein
MVPPPESGEVSVANAEGVKSNAGAIVIAVVGLQESVWVPRAAVVTSYVTDVDPAA